MTTSFLFPRRVGIQNCRRKPARYVSALGAVGRIDRAYLVANQKPDRIVIRKCSRELASVLLLRQAQPPRLSRNEKPRLISSSLRYLALKPCKQSRRSFPNRFRTSLRLIALVHDKDDSEGALKCTPKGFPISEKEFLRMQ